MTNLTYMASRCSTILALPLATRVSTRSRRVSAEPPAKPKPVKTYSWAIDSMEVEEDGLVVVK